MRSLLLLLFLIGFLSTSVGAANFACRDSKGHLYFTDNPLDVPDDCRQNMQQIEQQSTSVNSASPPAAKEVPIKQPENLKNQAIQKKLSDEQFTQLQQRAEVSAKKYAQGVETLEAAGKRRRFGSKARFAETQKMIDEGNKLIGEARQEKEQLLSDLDSQQVPAQQSAKIEKLLEPIH